MRKGKVHAYLLALTPLNHLVICWGPLSEVDLVYDVRVSGGMMIFALEGTWGKGKGYRAGMNAGRVRIEREVDQ